MAEISFNLGLEILLFDRNLDVEGTPIPHGRFNLGLEILLFDRSTGIRRPISVVAVSISDSRFFSLIVYSGRRWIHEQ